MFKGLRTVIFRVQSEDLEKAKLWYTQLLGKSPYFDQPFYVGFNVGGFELGLNPTKEKILLGNNVETYLGVSDITISLQTALKLEAKVVSNIQDVGENIRVATIHDPFGNILGLIENPNFKIEKNI